MTTICERGRRILPWILKRANVGDEFAAFDVTSRSLLHAELWNSVHDPAKLAEMLAARGRELGFDVPGPSEQSFWEQLVIDPLRAWNQIRIELPENDGVLVMSMSQARAILLQWLQLPDGAREEAERRLRGET